jgi:murein DD-endopeptidase MepM/ murein hydrolase activator NlpD
MGRAFHRFLGLLPAIAMSCLAFASDPGVTIRQIKEGDTVYIVATMTSVEEATITLTGTLNHMIAEPPFPLTVETDGSPTVILSVIRADRFNANGDMTWKSTWLPGKKASGPRNLAPYRLPYRDGKHLVIQGPHGKFSHDRGSLNEEALDFAMPIGTEVYAARRGVVVGLRDDCDAGGLDEKYKLDFNYVLLRQEDGVYAEYVHLKHLGCAVKLGQRVADGQLIGYSGNTGYCSEPHLHFCVFNTIDGNSRTTYKVKFKLPSGEIVEPVEGESY